MTRVNFKKSVSRRTVLTGGIACAVASIAPLRLAGEMTRSDSFSIDSFVRHTGREQSDLFVFPDELAMTTTVALVWQEIRICRLEESQVRIHIGTKQWEFDVTDKVSKLKTGQVNGPSVYVGEILSPLAAQKAIFKAVVISIPNRAIADSKPVSIWAERISSGLRHRTGTPFLSTLIAGDEQLAKWYHSSSPAQDRKLLSQPLAAAIATRAKGAVANPAAHGVRLASVLLPDVLYYDVSLPPGYTFAAQNGRHPLESSNELVNAFLQGGLASQKPTPKFHVQKSFPYFRLPSISA